MLPITVPSVPRSRPPLGSGPAPPSSPLPGESYASLKTRPTLPTHPQGERESDKGKQRGRDKERDRDRESGGQPGHTPSWSGHTLTAPAPEAWLRATFSLIERCPATPTLPAPGPSPEHTGAPTGQAVGLSPRWDSPPAAQDTTGSKVADRGKHVDSPGYLNLVISSNCWSSTNYEPDTQSHLTLPGAA